LTHPFVALLRERDMRILWTGLSLSALGDEVYRIGVIWLAIGISGTDAAYLPAAQYAALLLVSVLAGAFAERLSPRVMMIATDISRAILSIVPVLLWVTVGLTLEALVATAVALASLRALFDPALLSSVPRLARDSSQLQAANGLLDATSRLARLVGPFIAGSASLIIPTIHLLTLNSASLLASAAAVFSISPALEEQEPHSGKPAVSSTSFWIGVTRGYGIAWRQPFLRYVLAANAVILATWTLGLSLGVVMLMASQPPAGFENRRLVALGFVLGVWGAGDLLSNLLVAGHTPAARTRFMFSGYIVLGVGIIAIPLPLLLPLGAGQLPAMMLAAFFGGLGGPMFFLPMMTAFQELFEGADLRGILRLRLALTSLAMTVGAASGPYLFKHAGAALTVIGCGAIITAVGLAGVLTTTIARRRFQQFQPIKVDSSGTSASSKSTQ
jgi:DHA3 family macrolide efflux protein-like MFS transporter